MMAEASFEIKGMNIDDIANKIAKRAIKRLSIEAQKHAQDTINTFVNSKGHSVGVDSGAFRDGIKVEEINDGFGFRMSDSVPYGIYHEYGTTPHWLPFFDRSGNITGLGKWALQRFDLDGSFQVKGKSGKVLKSPSRKSREDVLRSMGGIIVSLDEMAPFRKAITHIKTIEADIFREEMNKGDKV